MFTAPRFHVKDVCWKHWVSLIWLGYWIRSKFRVRGDMWAAARHGEPGARSCAVSANMIMDRTVVAEGSSQSETHPTSTICILIASQWQRSNSYRSCSMLDTFCTWLLLFTVYCVECVCVSRILALAVLTIVQPTLCVALIKTNVHL